MQITMKDIMKNMVLSCLTAFFPLCMYGQYIAPVVSYTNEKGEEAVMEPGEAYTGSAPLTARFTANPSEDDGWTSYYEWRFSMEGADEPYLIRYEQDTEYTFNQAGVHKIVCYAVFTRGNERVEYTQDYWEYDSNPISFTISQSRLEMPNIFTPNGDNQNDTYHAKDNYQSIVEFRAIIFNRWGKKLYEWNDPAGSWDGKYNGQDMPQGVYYVLVNARGADGRKFVIKRDVNLIRDYSAESSRVPSN